MPKRRYRLHAQPPSAIEFGRHEIVREGFMTREDAG